jgi:mannose-6-phosphate isomerase-like protein (cupin superfamily)
MKIHRYAALLPKATPYIEFLRTKDLSVGIYRLSAGSEDKQQPHSEEEIYYVVAGRSRFRSGDTDIVVASGDVLFVPRNEPHQFHSIESDLELLVFFAPPEGSA